MPEMLGLKAQSADASIMMTSEGYVIIQGPLAGVGPQQYESVPFSEAQPSPDGEFWRCKRPDGTRRCFFAPPPAT